MNNNSFLRKILQPFYSFWVFATFITGFLPVIPFLMVTGMVNHPKARRIIFYILRNWIRGWLWIIGMPVKILGNKPPEDKYIIVANHISYLDTLVIFPALQGYFRVLGKKEISRIPIVGFIYKQVVILVDRSNAHSRAKSLRLLWRVLHHDSSILIFPEGTFNETGKPLKEFYDGAFRLAINTQTTLLPVIFPDTVKRWHYSGWWKWWPGKNRAIYLDPVKVEGMKMEDLPSLKQKVYVMMEEELMKYR